MRAGRALQQAWALDAAAAKVCHCGHPMGVHRELQSRWEARDGRPVEIKHPDYKPGDFHCGHDGCACVVNP